MELHEQASGKPQFVGLHPIILFFSVHSSAGMHMQLTDSVIIQKPSLHLESGELGCCPGVVAMEGNCACVKLQESRYFAKGVNLSGF